MAVATPQRPAAFANLKETPATSVVPEGSSYCTFHGKQAGLNCVECDKEFPEAVQARQLDAAPLSMGILPADVQAMIDKAVKAAIAQEQAFSAWKNSPEGQAAAAAAATSTGSTPQHGTLPGDPPSTVTPVA
jgi:hypothetical protein